MYKCPTDGLTLKDYTRLKRKARSPTQKGEDLQRKAGPKLTLVLPPVF
jgi:hypothetical protein